MINKQRVTDQKPDETGLFDGEMVNVWVTRVGACHGSYDYYDVFIQTIDGKFLKRFTEIYSNVPQFTTHAGE